MAALAELERGGPPRGRIIARDTTHFERRRIRELRLPLSRFTAFGVLPAAFTRLEPLVTVGPSEDSAQQTVLRVTKWPARIR